MSISHSEKLVLALRGTLAALTALVFRGVSIRSRGLSRGYSSPKATPDQVARTVLDAIEKDEEYIFPDPMSQQVHS